jgi:precorrin-2 dehydrogenase/sirohydrochlorin ferrochelatase
MLPIVLDPNVLRIGLAGAGEGFRRREALLAEAGVNLAARFEGVVPGDNDLQGLHILFAAGFDEAASQKLAQSARALRVLINAEDIPALCDFHVPGMIRRGAFLMTVSTGGQAPGLARLISRRLQERFGPEWAGRVEDVARERKAWRAAGLSPAEITARIESTCEEKGWFQ